MENPGRLSGFFVAYQCEMKASKNINISFFTAECSYVLRQKNDIRVWLTAVAKIEKQRIESLTYVFCSDEYLYKMNVQFLSHKTLTDIITFDTAESENGITGEIYISIDRVRENAAELGLLFRDELHRVMAHGLLHLCGYKDKLPSDKKRMTSREDFSLSLRKFL